MRIIHLITGLGIGGAENVVYNLAKGQIAAGHEVEVISVRSRTEMLPVFVAAGISVHVLGINKSVSSIIGGIGKSIALVKNLSPDLIHAHMAHACLLATFIKYRLPDVKLVFTAHNIIIGNKLVTYFIRISQKWRDADVIFSTSQQGSFNNPNRVHIIPNGVDTDNVAQSDLEHLPGQPFRFVAVGRLEKVKNHSFLLELATRLKDRYNFTIDIFGEGYLRDKLMEQINRNSLQQIVKLNGISMNITAELKHYHAFLMPSLWEGMPITILEAGAAHLPIVASAVGSIPDFLNSSNSYVCNLDDFQDQLSALMDNYPEAVRKAGLFNQYVVGECNMQQVVYRHISLYEALLK